MCWAIWGSYDALAFAWATRAICFPHATGTCWGLSDGDIPPDAPLCGSSPWPLWKALLVFLVPMFLLSGFLLLVGLALAAILQDCCQQIDSCLFAVCVCAEFTVVVSLLNGQSSGKARRGATLLPFVIA